MLALLDAWFIAPFDYGFMRRAVVGGLALSLAAPPLGVFLVLRGMSLIGDAMAHAILPGVALGFLLAGFSLPVMSVGGVLFGLMVALLAGAVSKMGGQREDAAMASFFIISLAAGVAALFSHCAAWSSAAWVRSQLSGECSCGSRRTTRKAMLKPWLVASRPSEAALQAKRGNWRRTLPRSVNGDAASHARSADS